MSVFIIYYLFIYICVFSCGKFVSFTKNNNNNDLKELKSEREDKYVPIKEKKK